MGSNNGSAYALERATGQVVWEREIGAWVGAGPAVSGNTVIFGAWDGNLYAFTEQNGTPGRGRGYGASSPTSPDLPPIDERW